MLDFAGTFNSSQFTRFRLWTINQFSDIPGRIGHLLAETQRIGTITSSYDNSSGNPISYSVQPTTSYIGKLMMAYEVLGGDPFFDLQIRTMGQAVYLTPGTNTTPAQRLSSGDILAQPGLNDALSANLMQQMRAWTQDVIQYKRENIERKIRRAVDYADQLTAEIQTLTVVIQDATSQGSVADLTTQIQALLADPTYRSIYQDTLNDVHGKFTHAPYTAYEPGPQRTIAPNYVRGEGGPILPGQQVAPTGTTPATTSNPVNPSRT
jgi:hypothetical protein